MPGANFNDSSQGSFYINLLIVFVLKIKVHKTIVIYYYLNQDILIKYSSLFV